MLKCKMIFTQNISKIKVQILNELKMKFKSYMMNKNKLQYHVSKNSIEGGREGKIKRALAHSFHSVVNIVVTLIQVKID